MVLAKPNKLYLTQHVGYDGYSYLLFQRMLLKSLSIFSLVDMAIRAVALLGWSFSEQQQDCVSLWTFSLVTLFFLRRTYSSLQSDYFMITVLQMDNSHILKLHTVEIRCSLCSAADRMLEVMSQHLANYLGRLMSGGGSVV